MTRRVQVFFMNDAIAMGLSEFDGEDTREEGWYWWVRYDGLGIVTDPKGPFPTREQATTDANAHSAYVSTVPIGKVGP